MNDNNINALLNNYCNVNQSGCSEGSPTAPNNSDVTITVDLSLPENSALATVGGTLALTANGLDDSGMLLYRQSENMVKVYSRICTHNACTIDSFQNGTSTCPCHGSQFIHRAVLSMDLLQIH